jgi:predicted transcriptional regulator
MSSGSDEKQRVQFRAPRGLVQRADSLAAVLETDRTDILISALRNYLREAAHSDEMKQEIADAFYEGEITFDELKDLVGHEEAANFRVLKEQLSDEFIDDVAEDLADS